MGSETNKPGKPASIVVFSVVVVLIVIVGILIRSALTGTITLPVLRLSLPDGARAAIENEVQSYTQVTGVQMAGYTIVQSQMGTPMQAMIGTHRDEVWCVIMDLPNAPNITAVEREVFRYWILYRSNLYWQALRNVTVDVFRQNNCDIG